MIRRRRRPSRETAFSFDSFLDLVTNVVGIIIRLILVAWVGARSYSSVAHLVRSDTPPGETAEVRAVTDPMQEEVERQRAELARTQEQLLEQMKHLTVAKAERSQAELKLAALGSLRQDLERSQAEAKLKGGEPLQANREFSLSLVELEKRRQRLTAELKELEKQPAKKVLHYRTPVSQAVRGEEAHFECRAGKVTHINLAELLPQIRRSLRDKEDQLKTQWQVSDVTEPSGAFRLRYTIERRRDTLEAALGGGGPDPYGNFGYGMSSWEVDPVTLERGEPGQVALTAGSEFRRLMDGVGSQQVAVTFWVYPDSFPLYRQLRDYLVDQGFTVAGRPLPDGTPIAGSTRGSLSRGQ